MTAAGEAPVAHERRSSIEGVACRDCWQKDDPKIREDVLALGRRMPKPSAATPEDFWTHGLCVAAYEGEELVSLSASEIKFSQRLRANMAFIRVFVAPDHRQRGIVVPLTLKTHEVLQRFALAHPEKQIGGTMAIVTARGVMDEPVTKAFMVLIGYTPQGEPLIVRWFDHYRLP